jgi:hypothetical protein
MKKRTKIVLLFIAAIFIFGVSGCVKEVKEEEGKTDSMKLASSAFQEGMPIPSKYSCDGENISPPLLIKDVPKNAKSLALIMEDPDAPLRTFVHWIAWNIPAEKREISEGEQLSWQGKNDFGNQSYGGPCPPSGMHRYFFRLYALDAELELRAGATKKELQAAMKGHVIAETALMGTYKR